MSSIPLSPTSLSKTNTIVGVPTTATTTTTTANTNNMIQRRQRISSQEGGGSTTTIQQRRSKMVSSSTTLPTSSSSSSSYRSRSYNNNNTYNNIGGIGSWEISNQQQYDMDNSNNSSNSRNYDVVDYNNNNNSSSSNNYSTIPSDHVALHIIDQQQQSTYRHRRQHTATTTSDNHDNSGDDMIMDVYNNTNNNNNIIHRQYSHTSNQYYNSTTNNYDPEIQQSQQYQNIGGQHRMLEEKVRQFQQSQSQQIQLQQQQQYLYNDNIPHDTVTPNYYYTSPSPSSTISTFNNAQQSSTGSIPTTSVAKVPIWKRKLVYDESFYRIEDYHTIFRTPHHVSDAQYTKYVLQEQQKQMQYKSVSPSSLRHSYDDQYDENDNNSPITSNANTSMMNKSCCAYTCSIFSGIAVIFLLFIGFLLDTQPLYIPGTLPTIVVQSTTSLQEGQQQQQQQRQALSQVQQQKPQKNTMKKQQKQGSTSSQQQQKKQRSSSSNTGSSTKRMPSKIQFLIPGKDDERLRIASNAYQAATMYFIVMILCQYIYNPIPFHNFYMNYISNTIFRTAKNKKLYHTIPDTSYDMIGNQYSNLNTTTTAIGSNTMEGLILSGPNGSIIDSSSLLPSAYNNANRRNTNNWGLYVTRTTNTMKRYLASKGWYVPNNKRKYHYEGKKTG